MSNKRNPMDVQTDFERHKERHSENPTEPIHSGLLKGIIAALCIIAAAAVIIIPIIVSGNRTSRLSIPDNIDKITIYQSGGSQTTLSYTDSGTIGQLTDYLTSLKLKTAKGVNEKEGILLGGGWEIRMFSGGSVYGINLIGNTYLQDPDGNWWTITDGEDQLFEELVKELQH